MCIYPRNKKTTCYETCICVSICVYMRGPPQYVYIICVYVCICVCMCIYVYIMCICVCIYVYICVYVNKYVYICVYMLCISSLPALGGFDAGQGGFAVVLGQLGFKTTPNLPGGFGVYYQGKHDML